MKKVIFGSVAVVALGYIGTTFYVGGQAEEQVKNTIQLVDKTLQEQMREAMGPSLNVAVVNYNRGLFSSTADLKMSINLGDMLPPKKMPVDKLDYTVKLHINHGPFIFAIGKPGLAYVNSTIELPEKYKKLARMQLASDSTFPKVGLNFLIHFDDTAQFKADIPEFQLLPKAVPGKVIWKGMEATYNVSNQFQTIVGQTFVNGMVLESPMANAELSKVTMAYHLDKSPQGLWTGNALMQFPSLAVSMMGKSIFELDKLSFKSSAEIKESLLNMSLSASLNKVLVKDKTYGPGDLNFLVDKFDADVFARMQKTLQQINSPTLSRKEKNKLLDTIEKDFPLLVNKGAELNLKNLSMQFPEGTLKANASAKVPAGLKVKNNLELADHVDAQAYVKVPSVFVKAALEKQAVRSLKQEQMLQQLSGHTENRVSDAEEKPAPQPASDNLKTLSQSEIIALAEQKVDDQINKLLEQKVLLAEDNTYVFKFTYNKGHLFINGKPFSPELFKQ